MPSQMCVPKTYRDLVGDEPLLPPAVQKTAVKAVFAGAVGIASGTLDALFVRDPDASPSHLGELLVPLSFAVAGNLKSLDRLPVAAFDAGSAYTGYVSGYALAFAAVRTVKEYLA